VTDDHVKQRQKLEAQVEGWTAEAKRLTELGKHAGALDLYRRAADELAGAPWLQHRTAELCRKLAQNAPAIHYYRRAATAFQLAAFPKRALGPLRTAWSLAVDGLPATSRVLIELSTELVHVQRGLGLSADATMTLERTNGILRSRGFSEMGEQALTPVDASPARVPLPQRASSAPPPRVVPAPTPIPPSEVSPRSSASPPSQQTPSSRSRAPIRAMGRG
jgi:hypothetical protein